MLNIELRKITYNSRLSEETSCYSADLYLDGKLLAHVANRGHGGCDEVHPAKGRTYSEVKALDDLIKATYPKRDTGMELKGEPFIMDEDLETVCGDLLTKHLVERDVKRDLKAKLVFVRKDKPGIYTVSLRNIAPQQREEFKRLVKINNNVDRFLEDIPLAEAVDLYMKAA